MYTLYFIVLSMQEKNYFAVLFTLREKESKFSKWHSFNWGENLTDFAACENTNKQLFKLKDLELALKLSKSLKIMLD
jgi:hypothetical protein